MFHWNHFPYNHSRCLELDTTQNRLIKGDTMNFGTRYTAWGLLLAGSILFQGLGNATADNTPSPHKPNFLFIYADDQRWDALGCVQREQGADGRLPWIKTPNLDRIAAEGIRFRKAFVVNSLCSPSRASFLTGQYSHLNGVADNETPFPLDSATYATELKKVGYTTAYFGKWHHGKQPQRPGFDEVASFLGQGIYDDCPILVNGVNTPTKGYVDNITTDYLIDFLRKYKDRPFCAVLGFKAVHDPRTPTEKHKDDYSGVEMRPAVNAEALAPYLVKKHRKSDGTSPYRREYFRCVNGIDDNVGRILDALDELGLAEDTVVIYSSDNGYYLGEHGLGDKRTAYEESLLIPLLVRWPRVVEPGRIADQMVLNIDLSSTLLDLAGAPIPPQMQGISWKPLLEGKNIGHWRKSFFYTYFMEKQYPWVPNVLAVRADNAKLIRYPGHDEWTELFDLKADPYETKNLWNNPEAKSLRDRMAAEFERQLETVDFRVPDYVAKPGKTP